MKGVANLVEKIFKMSKSFHLCVHMLGFSGSLVRNRSTISGLHPKKALFLYYNSFYYFSNVMSTNDRYIDKRLL